MRSLSKTLIMLAMLTVIGRSYTKAPFKCELTNDPSEVRVIIDDVSHYLDAIEKLSVGVTQSVGPDAFTSVTTANLDGLRGMSNLHLSPDGGMIAFGRDGSVWLLAAKAGSTPREVASGTGAIWSPAGGALAFFAQDEETGGFQVFRYDLESDQSVRLTALPGGVVPEKVDWSRDDRLVFAADVPLEVVPGAEGRPGTAPVPASDEMATPLVLDEKSPDGYALGGLLPGKGAPGGQAVRMASELFVHDLATGQTTRLTHDRAGYFSPAWSPDGRAIVCASQEGRGLGTFVNALCLINGETGERTPLDTTLNTRKHDPQWSPDGRLIAYAEHSFSDESAHGLIVVSVDGARAVRPSRRLLRAPVEALAWSADGTALFVIYADGVTKPVFLVDRETGATRLVGSAEHMAYTSTLTVSASGAVAWGESRGDVPIVLRLLLPGAAESEEIYDPNPQVRSWALGEQEVVRWTNCHGHQRAGILIKPAGYQPGMTYPLIVSAYSQGTHFNGFQSVTHPGFGNQAFASRGYAVFFPGPRLPWHYGASTASEAEAAAIRGADGWDVAVDDVESGVDALIERGIVDSERMAVVGFSNGGAAVAAVVTRTDRYRAAVCVSPANLNWIELALFEDNRSGRWVPPATFTGIGLSILDNPDPYVRGSLVLQMGDVKTPMLLAIGDRDDASFVLPTVEMYLALRGRGKTVTLLRYPGMGHGFYGPAGQDLYGRIERFLDERLGMATR